MILCGWTKVVANKNSALRKHYLERVATFGETVKIYSSPAGAVHPRYCDGEVTDL
jgi:hypothetical protein